MTLFATTLCNKILKYLWTNEVDKNWLQTQQHDVTTRQQATTSQEGTHIWRGEEKFIILTVVIIIDHISLNKFDTSGGRLTIFLEKIWFILKSKMVSSCHNEWRRVDTFIISPIYSNCLKEILQMLVHVLSLKHDLRVDTY